MQKIVLKDSKICEDMMSFKTQLKIEFLLPVPGRTKLLRFLFQKIEF